MKLTEKQRELFVMMYEGGGTIAQISRVIGFPAEQFTEVRNLNEIPMRLQNIKGAGGKLIAPDGLLEDAKTMHLPELMSKYQLGRKMVISILADNGVRAIDGEVKRKSLGLSRVEPIVRKPERVESIHERAADYLRRFYANVHRCDIKVFEHQRVTWGDLNNVPDHGVGYYYVDGRGVLTNVQVLSIARERGFAEDNGRVY